MEPVHTYGNTYIMYCYTYSTVHTVQNMYKVSSYSVIDYVLLYRQCLQYVGENNMEPVYTNTVKIQIMYCFTYSIRYMQIMYNVQELQSEHVHFVQCTATDSTLCCRYLYLCRTEKGQCEEK